MRDIKLYTAKEIGELLGVSRQWIEIEARKPVNPLPRYHLGRLRRYDLNEVLDWIRLRQNKGKADSS